MPHCSVYHLSREALSQVDEGVHTPGGSSVIPEARLLDSGISMPNGLAFSPDEKVLYIANSGPTPEILAFDVTWHDERTKKSSKTGRAAKTQRSSGKKSETKRQSLDELLQELDEDDEDAGKVAMEGETVDAHAEPTEGTETQTSGASVTISNRRIFADFRALSKRCDESAPSADASLYNGPDGLKVDAQGNVYVAGACGVHIFP